VPGVAFDMDGYRIGFGKGYYDRYLSGITAKLPVIAGLCHDFQLVNSLPREPHDIRMDMVVTDLRIVDLSSNRLSLTVG